MSKTAYPDKDEEAEGGEEKGEVFVVHETHSVKRLELNSYLALDLTYLIIESNSCKAASMRFICTRCTLLLFLL